MSDPEVEKQLRILAMEAFRKGYARQMEGRLEEAIVAYRESLSLHPTAEAHTFLGWTYSFQGRLAEAIRECHEAIRVDPSFGNPYNDIGAYLLQLGKPEEAILWLERARKAPRYESPHYPLCNLGRAYELLGRPGEAREAYLGALEIEPDYRPAVEALRRLEKLPSG